MTTRVRTSIHDGKYFKPETRQYYDDGEKNGRTGGALSENGIRFALATRPLPIILRHFCPICCLKTQKKRHNTFFKINHSLFKTPTKYSKK